MKTVDALGYVAAVLVLLTFCMRSMVWLRSLAIAGNAAFIGYGVMADIHPVLLLHLALLPVNGWRLLEALRRSSGRLSVAKRFAASGASPVLDDSLQTFRSPISPPEGSRSTLDL